MHNNLSRIPLRTRVKYALLHSWHVVLLAGSTVFGVANWSWWIFFSVLFTAELLLVATVINLTPFKRYVQERLTNLAGIKTNEAVISILEQMKSSDKVEFTKLRNLIVQLEFRLSNYPSISTSLIEECKSLLQEYARVAIQMSLMMSGPSADLSDLNYRLAYAKSQHRIDRLTRHIEWRNQTKSIQEDAEQYLASIADSIYFLIDRTALSLSSTLQLKTRVSDESNLQIDQAAIEEMAEFIHVEDIDLSTIF